VTEGKCEIVVLQPVGDFNLVQVAVNGVLSVPFWDSREYSKMLSEDLFLAHLYEVGSQMVMTYGDARKQKVN